jgi:hypothetical protein
MSHVEKGGDAYDYAGTYNNTMLTFGINKGSASQTMRRKID